jgi:hypothetical protein
MKCIYLGRIIELVKEPLQASAAGMIAMIASMFG